MKNQKNKKTMIGLIVLAVAVIAIVGTVCFFLLKRGSEDSDEVAYVDSVSMITGSGLGGYNRYAGVVETGKSWSVNKDADNKVKEVHVSVGDEVKEGDPLFTYDTDELNSNLTQANIDMQRLVNEQNSINTTIGQLETEKRSASSSEQGDYTIQIQEQQLALQQKGLDIETKQGEIDKLQDKLDNATVKSQIDGVVKSIQDDSTGTDSYDSGSSDAYITIMQTSSLRIKGTVNEQNIGLLIEGMDVQVVSRVDENDTRTGTITSIDRENATTRNNDMYGLSGSDSTSTSYPFYVEISDTDGLMLGQHVYVIPDNGMGDNEKSGIHLDEFYICDVDSDPYVWADNGKGKLEKRSVTLGDYDEEMMTYEIKDGLSLDDMIAFPDESYKEGMKTMTMDELMEQMMVEGDEMFYEDEEYFDEDEEFMMDEEMFYEDEE